ncbi:MAG: metallophosphoesterase [Bacteroidia bacterium]
MKLLLLSDIHDHIWHLEALLQADLGAGVLLCCGDLCSPFVMGMMGRLFGGDIHIVSGNNDADLLRITRTAAGFGPRVHLHGEGVALVIDGLHIALNHYDTLARDIAASGRYDVVCFGHNHRREQTIEQHAGREVLLLNPGPVMGVAFDQGLPVPVAASFMVLDTRTRQADSYELRDGRVLPLA